MFTAGEPQDKISIVLRGLEERWERLKDKLADTQTKVELNFEMKKFYSELSALQDLMAVYEKWISSADSIADDAPEITRQLDQCKVWFEVVLPVHLSRGNPTDKLVKTIIKYFSLLLFIKVSYSYIP